MGWNNATLDAYNDDIISLWELDEASGTRYRLVGDHDLTDNNTVGQATGRIGDAADFIKANSEYLNCPDLLKGKTKLSVSCWIYLGTASDRSFIAESYNDINVRLEMRAQANDTLRIGITDSGWKSATSTNTFSSSTWYHILGVIDTVADTIEAWVNDSKWIDASVSMAALTSLSSTLGFMVGRGYSSSYCQGRVDQVVLWNEALGSAEATALYNSDSGRAYILDTPIRLSPLSVEKGGRHQRKIRSFFTTEAFRYAPPVAPLSVVPSFLKANGSRDKRIEHKSISFFLDAAIRHAPSEAALTFNPENFKIKYARGVRIKRIPRSHSFLGKPPGPYRWYADAVGMYRVFNESEYRFYRTNTGIPPSEEDPPYAVSATLPATPPDSYSDGVWFISVSWYNGILDSGFLPIGLHGETYLRLELDSGAEIGNPPSDSQDKVLIQKAGGVILINAFYSGIPDRQSGADQWAMWYTFDGGDPVAVGEPDAIKVMSVSGLAILSYALPAQAHDVVVKVILKTRRNDGTVESPVWIYSEDETIMTILADAEGPSSPPAGDFWRGV